MREREPKPGRAGARLASIPWEADSDPSIVIVETVASATDRDPLELPPLQETLEVDTLDALFSDPGIERTGVTFHYAGVVVTVDTDAGVDVWELRGPE
jgi:hypothetical protein